MKSDHQTYCQLRDAMRCMIRAGMFNSLAFEDAWRMTEAIKNRNGGMPPMPDPDDIDDENQILAETGVELGVR